MSKREKAGNNLEPGFVARVAAGIRYAATGEKPAEFFGPSKPLAPSAQEPEQGAVGRKFDYAFAVNTNISPRQGENLSFSDLRGIADGYDLLRLAIETRKDQIVAFRWGIHAEDGDEEAVSGDIKKVTDFLNQPSPEYDWGSWLRCSIEDILVLDAWAIYPNYNRGGKLHSLDLVDAATIKRVLDVSGRTPSAPDPAYQQVLHGIPAVNYTSDDLMYSMRNPRTNRAYGYSPTEQVVVTVNIALRRQMSQLAHYTTGNIPEAMIGVDPSWTAEQISEMQIYFDSILSGNSEAKRKLTFLPGDASKMQFTRDPKLKDEYDEWLSRIICYAFSLPPTAFVKEQNRATAETASDTAKNEGLLPLLEWIKRRMDYIIAKYIGAPHLRFEWDMSAQIDPVTQSGINLNRVRSGIMTIDEMRRADGEEALPDGIGSVPLIYTGAGAIRLSDVITPPPIVDAGPVTVGGVS